MKMKRFFYAAFMPLMFASVFISCDKDDDSGVDNSNPSKITASNVVSSSSKIATVVAELPWKTGTYDYGWSAIADAPYKNNGFTMKLPETLAAKYLFSISDNIPSEITISDKTAKTAELSSFKVLDNNDNEIGEIIYASMDNESNGVLVSWVYVDKDVTINGQYNEIDGDDEDIRIYNNCTLKKGWNIAYQRITRTYKSAGRIKTHTHSIQKPSGANLKWYFEIDD